MKYTQVTGKTFNLPYFSRTPELHSLAVIQTYEKTMKKNASKYKSDVNFNYVWLTWTVTLS